MQDCQAPCPQTYGATALSAQQSKAVSFPPEAEASEESLTKMYTCRTDIQYPETWDERMTMLNNIENLIKSTTESSIDLDFLRERILEEHVEEVMVMDFTELSSMDLRKLPWFKIKFEGIALTAGSTILDFRLTFKEPPRNLEDVNVYRLMELLVLSIIENIEFIKSVEPIKQRDSDNNTVLQLRFKTYNTGYDEEVLQKILNHVRGTIAHVAGEAASDNLSEKEVEDILTELMSNMSEKDVSNCLHGLCPRSLRELIKMSKVATKDMAEITFVFDSTKKKNKCIKKPSSETRCWLFPYDFRKISDLPTNDLMDIMHDLTDFLPKENGLWYKFMKHLKPILNPYEMNDLQERVSTLHNPYSMIIEQFSNKGGTLGGLLKAAEELKKTPDLSEADVKRIADYLEKVEDIRTNAFDTLLDQMYCPSTIPHVKSMQEFEELVSRSQRLKTAIMKRFTEIQDTLEQGDQLWIFHQRWFMRSYAHVVIIGSEKNFIHVSAPDVKLIMRSRAKICEGNFASLAKDDDLCFVVRPEAQGDLPKAIFRWRAEVCLEMRFDYDAASSNCETFANAVHGLWAEGQQASFLLINILG